MNEKLNGVINIIKSSETKLYILCGYPYSGKSYVAEKIVSETGIKLISIDSIFESVGFSWDDNRLPTTAEWENIFTIAYERIAETLAVGESVLFDSTNHTHVSRNKLKEIADAHNAEYSLIYVKTTVETVWQRWEENNLNPTRSKVSSELVQQTIDAFEEPNENENVIVIEN
jgi:predicted kinase